MEIFCLYVDAQKNLLSKDYYNPMYRINIGPVNSLILGHSCWSTDQCFFNVSGPIVQGIFS